MAWKETLKKYLKESWEFEKEMFRKNPAQLKALGFMLAAIPLLYAAGYAAQSITFTMGQNTKNYSQDTSLQSSLSHARLIRPTRQNLGDGIQNYFFEISPENSLLEGLTTDKLYSDYSQLTKYFSIVEAGCAEPGLLEYDPVSGADYSMTASELLKEAPSIFEYLQQQYGPKEMPEIVFEKLGNHAGGQYNELENIITLSNISIFTLLHELTHVWIHAESPTQLASLEAAVRLAKLHGQNYEKSGDAAEGRLACQYALAVIDELQSENVFGAANFFYEEKYPDMKTEESTRNTLYGAVPYLTLRQAATSTSETPAEFATKEGIKFEIDSSAELFGHILYGDQLSETGFPFQ